jgi:O-antigen/teichoic acid export membrane protein
MSLREIGKNSAWNLVGQVAPVLMAILVIPLLVKLLGADRYGFLTLVWVLMGYFSIFDFGVGRAMTRVVAERLGAGDRAGSDAVAQTAMAFLLVMGIAVAIGLLLVAGLVVRQLSLPARLVDEGVGAVRILALGLPFVMLTSGYRGCLEAHRHFPTVSMIQVGMGFLTYLAPLMAVAVSPRLEVMVTSVVLMRVLANMVFRWACRRECDFNLRLQLPDRARLRRLLGIGGWMTVSNIVSPLMNSMDRLIIGGLVPVAAVGYYATAFDMVTKIVMLPYSLMSAAFPVLAGAKTESEARALYVLVFKCIVLSVLPILIIVVAYAGPVFELWVGGAFAREAAPLAQILAIGLFFNCAAQAPVILIMSRGKPKWIAVNHLCELPLFVGLLFALTREYGILGTAIAWSVRVAVDAVVLFTIAEIMMFRGALRLHTCLIIVGMALASFAAVFASVGLAAKSASLGLSLVVFVPVFWFGLLDRAERTHVLNAFRQRREANT